MDVHSHFRTGKEIMDTFPMVAKIGSRGVPVEASVEKPHRGMN